MSPLRYIIGWSGLGSFCKTQPVIGAILFIDVSGAKFTGLYTRIHPEYDV